MFSFISLYSNENIDFYIHRDGKLISFYFRVKIHLSPTNAHWLPRISISIRKIYLFQQFNVQQKYSKFHQMLFRLLHWPERMTEYSNEDFIGENISSKTFF